MIWQNEKSEMHQKRWLLTHQANRSPGCFMEEKEHGDRDHPLTTSFPQRDIFLQNSLRKVEDEIYPQASVYSEENTSHFT